MGVITLIFFLNKFSLKNESKVLSVSPDALCGRNGPVLHLRQLQFDARRKDIRRRAFDLHGQQSVLVRHVGIAQKHEALKRISNNECRSNVFCLFKT